MDAMSVLNSDSLNIVRISTPQYNSIKVSQVRNHNLRTLTMEKKSIPEMLMHLNHLAWLSVPKKILLKYVIRF